jgi:hypothetical protein
VDTAIFYPSISKNRNEILIAMLIIHTTSPFENHGSKGNHPSSGWKESSICGTKILRPSSSRHNK